jgi:hypothetical protein
MAIRRPKQKQTTTQHVEHVAGVTMPVDNVEQSERGRRRITDDEPVYFAAKTGVLPIESASYDWVNPTTKVTKPGLVLHFGEKGVTRGYDPNHPEDARVIQGVREWIAEGRDPRIAQLKVREITPNNAPPFGAWDDTSARAIQALVMDGVIELRKAVVYEESKGDAARQDVLDVLYDAIEHPVDDPLAISETV